MSDTELIDTLGGATRVAELLGYGANGAQRVHNWRTRGIPARVKLERPDLFLSHALKHSVDEASAPSPEIATAS